MTLPKGFWRLELLGLEELDKSCARRQRYSLADCHSKSKIAVEYCYLSKDENPEGHMFWVRGSRIT
jgi:hypothetical protein